MNGASGVIGAFAHSPVDWPIEAFRVDIDGYFNRRPTEATNVPEALQKASIATSLNAQVSKAVACRIIINIVITQIC